MGWFCATNFVLDSEGTGRKIVTQIEYGGTHACKDFQQAQITAQRIVDCMNALVGLNPEVVPDMVKALEFVVEEGREVCSVMAAAVLTKARRQ